MDSEYLDPAWTSGESLDWFWQLISDWMTPPGGILGRSDWEEVSGVEPEHTGGIMYLTWAGNPLWDLRPDHLFLQECFYFPLKPSLYFNLSVTAVHNSKKLPGLNPLAWTMDGWK